MSWIFKMVEGNTYNKKSSSLLKLDALYYYITQSPASY